MNVYLLIEDGESFCIRAKTMNDAVNVCIASYLDECQEEDGINYRKSYSRDYYHEQILESCSLVGRLKN